VAVTAPTWAALCQEATDWNIKDILQGQKHLRDSEVQIKNTTQPRLWLEITLLGLLPSALSQPQGVTINSGNTIPSPREQLPVSQGNNLVTKPTNGGNIKTITGENPPVTSEAIVSSSSNPVQDNPISTISTPNSSEPELWERVLAHITQFSTQTLLRQQGNLISFQNNVAHIGLKNQSLVAIAQKNQPYIEAAFQAVCREKITVKLEVATVTNSLPKAEPPAPPTGRQQVSELPPPKSLPQNKEPIKVNGKAPENQPPTVTPQINLEEKKIDNGRNPLPLSLEQVTKAAEAIAKFFDGEIIVLDDLENGLGMGTEEDIVNNKEPLIKGRPDVSTIDEEDIPF
jgi:DNA polymerase-3 subunit gamma/tau